MSRLGSIKPGWRTGCLPKSKEQYIAFSWGIFRFLDSIAFMNASLETLAGNLEIENFKLTKMCFDETEIEYFRKGVFPYEYMDSYHRFSESQLPGIEKFYSKLKHEDISQDDYAHAQAVWVHFNIRDLGEYQALYNRTDVLLLADIFENFRSICLKYYGLDPCHMYTAPGFTFEACLKYAKVKIELLTDINMHLFIEAGIRGGVSQISHRHARANNKYMKANYIPDEPSKYLVYLDANNLYGWAMQVYLPIGDFSWLSDDEIRTLDILNVPDEGPEGYILEVDLDYPQDLHQLHNEYPLAPEHVAITPAMLSPYARRLHGEGTLPTSVPKLVPNLNNKRNYIIHYRNLKQYLNLGLKLVHVHRVMHFRQEPWLKPYIELNTNFRKAARSKFEKDYFKLLINSFFGKTCEQLRKRVRVELVTLPWIAQKMNNNPALKDLTIISRDLTVYEMKKISVKLNRPLYVGFTVLENSKCLMYDFHYNHIKRKYGQNAKLCFTDTDSLFYSIETDDLYKDMGNDSKLYDFSDYPTSHVLYNDVNKKVIGKFKDEYNGTVISEFIGLRSKMYSILDVHDKNKRTGKGIARATMTHCISHNDYRNALFNEETQSASMISIQSRAHRLQTVNVNKTTLSAYDDKRFLLEDGVSSLAYGHHKI